MGGGEGGGGGSFVWLLVSHLTKITFPGIILSRNFGQ